MVSGSWQVSWTGSESGWASLSGTYPICQDGAVENEYGSADGYPGVPQPDGNLNPSPYIYWSDGSYGSTPSYTINAQSPYCTSLSSSTWNVDIGVSNNNGEEVYYPDLYATAVVQLNCDSGECSPDNGEAYVEYNW